MITALSMLGFPDCFIIALITKLFVSISLFPVMGSTKEDNTCTVCPKDKKGVDSPGGKATSLETIMADGSLDLTTEPSSYSKVGAIMRNFCGFKENIAKSFDSPLDSIVT